jgi:hypothetical protein
MKFENDRAIQKAMRQFSSNALAKIIIHNRDMTDCFQRNMNEICWHFVENELNELTEETPEQVFNRFEREYAKAESEND